MPTLPFPMRDTALDEAARRILRILQAEEEAKRRFASIESSGPSRGRSINRSEVTSRSGPRDVWDSAQATIPIGPRIGPLRLPMPEPAPPLIDPIPPIPVPNPDARRTKRKNCIDQYERCYTQKWWTAPGWRCENCMKYCIAMASGHMSHADRVSPTQTRTAATRLVEVTAEEQSQVAAGRLVTSHGCDTR